MFVIRFSGEFARFHGNEFFEDKGSAVARLHQLRAILKPEAHSTFKLFELSPVTRLTSPRLRAGVHKFH